MALIIALLAAFLLWVGWYLSTAPNVPKATVRELSGLGVIVAGGVLLWSAGMIYGAAA